MTASDIATTGWKELKIDGFMQLVGPLLRSTQFDEEPSYALQTHKHHTNPIGMIHGGVITSLLDQVIALTAWKAADRQPCVTVQMDTRFIGSAKAGHLLEIRPKIQHTTRSLIFVDAEITCGGTLIASATAIMKIITPKGNAQ